MNRVSKKHTTIALPSTVHAWLADYLSHFVSNYFYFILFSTERPIEEMGRNSYFKNRAFCWCSCVLSVTRNLKETLHSEQHLRQVQRGVEGISEAVFLWHSTELEHRSFPCNWRYKGKKINHPTNTEVYWTMYSKWPEKSCLSLQRYWKTFKCECQKARTPSWKRRAFEFFFQRSRVFFVLIMSGWVLSRVAST